MIPIRNQKGLNRANLVFALSARGEHKVRYKKLSFDCELL